VQQDLPYGTNMKRWNLCLNGQCPQYHQPAEGKDHLTQCQASGAKEQWEMVVQTLDDWMQTQQTEGFDEK